jgi:septum formation topological specificity factor MinE
VPPESAHAFLTPTDLPRNETDVLDVQEKNLEAEVLHLMQKHLEVETEIFGFLPKLPELEAEVFDFLHKYLDLEAEMLEFLHKHPEREAEMLDLLEKILDFYRLVRKYMPQPGLMKMRRTFIDKTCLSSDVASSAFANFLNSAHPSLKYAIQFLLIDIPQNPLQALKKLILVSQMNPFEFSLTVENKYKSLVARLGE